MVLRDLQRYCLLNIYTQKMYIMIMIKSFADKGTELVYNDNRQCKIETCTALEDIKTYSYT